MSRAFDRESIPELSNADLDACCGTVTVARGLAYAQRHHVIDLDASPDHREVEGHVIGSSGQTYLTTVRLRPDATNPWLHHWSSSCTCPVGADCKHAVALAVAARVLREPDGPPPGRRWESALSPLLDVEDDTPHSPLGLLIEPITAGSARRTRWTVPSASGRPGLRMRPVVPGARGDWIRTGVSWESFAGGYYAYGHATFSDDMRDAMTAIADAHRRAVRAYGFGRMPDAIALDKLGAHWCALLEKAQQCGVALMTHPRQPSPVRIAPDPAAFVIEIERAGRDAVLRPGIDLPATIPGEATLVGNPATGWFAWDGPLVVLGRLAEPLDAARQRLVDAGPIEIPEADWGRFVATVLPGLRRRAEVRAVGPAIELPEEVPPRLRLSSTFEPGHQVLLEWQVVYGTGENAVHVPLQYDYQDPIRDRMAEQELIAALRPVVTMERLWQRIGVDRTLVPVIRLHNFDTVAFSAVLADLQHLPELDVIVVGEPTAYTEVLDAPQIAFSATESAEGSGTDWFDLGISVTVAGEEVPLAQLIQALTQDASHLLLESGTWFSLDRPELERLRVLLDEARELQDRPSEGLRIGMVHVSLWEELVSLGVIDRQSARWEQAVTALADLGSREPVPPPAGLSADLRPYQLEGYQWLSLLWDVRMGGILADDMGLGKTLQVLAMVQRAAEEGTLADPVLIVAPTSVLSTWASEAARFAPALRSVILERTRGKAKVPLADAVGDAQLVITSYAVARIDEAAFRERSWSALVLDEAQFVKNHQSKTYQVMRRLPATRRFALTGTPLENSLMDLWSLLSLAAPGLYPRPTAFRDQWARPIESGSDPDRLATLRRRIRPLMLRRTKEAVATELPPKQEQVLTVALQSRHRAVYDRHLGRERQRILGLLDDVDGNRFAILRALTTLRLLALDPVLVSPEYAGLGASAKIETLVEHLTELAAEGHRALVFSQFTGFLTMAREALEQAGLETCYLDGSTRNRPEVIDRFRTGSADAFLISLKAGGFGLTLTEADYVFVVDPWWNPAAEAQAIDRTHRIGQTSPVNVYRLVSADTIEEKVVALQERKRDLFTRVVDEGALLSSALNAEDLRGLLER